LKDEIESKIKNLAKGPRKKIKNQKNKNQNEKRNIRETVIEGLSWKRKQNFYKKNKKEIRNQKSEK
jgi:hypothetical protein